jgi:hypothetical protein
MLDYMGRYGKPISCPDLALALDAKPGVVYNAMRRFHRQKLAHIAGYALTPNARPIALWVLGAGKDAPKLTPAEMIVQMMEDQP